MATAYTSLLGLALPVTGELSGSWGDVVNDSITSLLDSAISGTTTLSADADVTLTSSDGVADQARQAILLWTAGGSTTRNITAPAQSKAYFVVNKTSSTQSIVIRGAGPTTGVTVRAGQQALVVWNGVDFVEVASGDVDGPSSATDNAVARFDGTTGKLIQNSVVTIADSTGNMAGVGTLGVGAITTSGALTYGGVTLNNAVTGTGDMVLSTSPTLVTPALGTPSALVGTNITGTAAGLTAGNVTTNANLTGAITSTGNATLLGSFSSANLAGALTDETGTGSAVFANSPTLVTPALGTPASGVVTNLTGTASININGTVGATTANTGAFTTLSASGVTTVQAGTAAAPAITTSGDTNTGIFFPAADTIAFSEGGAEAMRITSAGNVGIGTSSPLAKLHVQNQVYVKGTGGGDGTIGIDINSGGSAVTTSAHAIRSGGGTGNLLILETQTANSNGQIIFQTNGSERARITSGGEFGIGTTNPTSKLTVSGSGATLGQFISSGSASYIEMDNSGGGGYIGTTGNNLVFLTSTAGTERARITSGGELLVGKTSTADAVVGFQVEPSGRVLTASAASTSAENTYIVYSTGASAYRFYVGLGGTVNATNTTISAISDQRLKENVQDLDVGLDKIMALKPRKFDWKEGKGKDIKGDRGWIAQEFEQVFPDMIDTWMDKAPEGEEPYKSVRADLIPVLVKAMQEQQAIINSLKARLDAANL
jgi:Chaperone of endosialidase